MRILHVEPHRAHPAVQQRLSTVGTVDYRDCADQTAFLHAISAAPYRAVFVRLGLAVNREILDAAPNLEYVVTPTTGHDHLDTAELDRRGIRLISLRGETAFLDSIRSTAEHTWLLVLALRRRLWPAAADVCAGRWRREPFMGEETDGQTLGIIGLGRLGRMVAEIANVFRMRVLAYDTNAAAFAQTTATVERADLSMLFAQSDVVSLHLPLDAHTERFLDAPRLAAMKRGAMLVNTARGELVDETALLEALQTSHLRGAALDVLAGDSVWDEDGPGASHPLIAYARTHDNLLITPHIGGYARQSIERTRDFTAQRFIAAIHSEATSQ